jgi:ribosomal protein uL22
MMGYSININKSESVVLAQRYNINASYKDLGAVCDAVRYLRVDHALELLGKVMEQEMPIPYRRHSKHMGARHELGGRKGGYPVKAANEVRLTILNAIGNAKNKGLSGEEMFIIHSSSNKTIIARRYPSKGSIAWGRGMYGRSAINHSDIEYAKVEIGLGNGDEQQLTHNMKHFIKEKNKNLKTAVKKKVEKKPQKKQEAKKDEAPKQLPPANKEAAARPQTPATSAPNKSTDAKATTM